jgi:hypothetical protein
MPKELKGLIDYPNVKEFSRYAELILAEIKTRSREAK